MAEINISLPEDYELDLKFLQKNLWQGCLDKVTASPEYSKCIKRKMRYHFAWWILIQWRYIPCKIITVHILSGIIGWKWILRRMR